MFKLKSVVKNYIRKSNTNTKSQSTYNSSRLSSIEIVVAAAAVHFELTIGGYLFLGTVENHGTKW